MAEIATRPRLAELLAALSLASDLGLGAPLERGLRLVLVSSRLTELAGLAPDVTYANPQATYSGRDEAGASFATEWKAFPDGRHHIDRVVETATGIAAECSWAGTHTGPLATPMGEVPPTQRRVTAVYSIWVDIEAGLAKKIRVYFDQMDYAAQLGLIPQPQQA